MTDEVQNEHEPNTIDDIQTKLRRALLANNETTELTEKFRGLISHDERIYFAYELLKKHDLLPKLINVEKSDEKSEERRKFGNHNYIALKRDYTALRHYNKSIAYAKSPEVLALAYGNRSAILYEHKLYQECIEDIKNAFENGYPQHLHQKLNQRKEKAEKQLLENRISRENYFTEIPEVKEKNKHFECALNCIEIRNDDTMGRHLIATQNIDPGEVIAVEKPYTQILLHDSYLTHCQNCLKVSNNLIPCLKCPLTLYCSTNCRQKAWDDFHQFECALLDTLHSLEATKIHLLALRVVLCARKEFSRLISGENFEINFKNYKSENYMEIHNLITNEERRSVSDLFSRSVVAAVLFYLLSFTDFYEEFDGNNTEDIKNCTAVLLLKHLQTAPSNMHQISELQGNADNGYDVEEIGAAAYAFMSLLNHSCSPNVVRHSHGTTMVLRALRPIRIGQQLFDNYGYHHALMPLNERRTHLKDQYLFDCECEACINDWPLYLNLSEGNKNFVVSEEEITALQNGNREMAQKLIPHLLINAKNNDSIDPEKFMEILDNQEILKQCFAVLGNKNTVFSN